MLRIRPNTALIPLRRACVVGATVVTLSTPVWAAQPPIQAVARLSPPSLVPRRSEHERSLTALLWWLAETFRVSLRTIWLCVLFTPALFTYPISTFFEDKTWWFNVLCFSLEKAGPCFVKLGQWASTRQDLFPDDFCQALSRLQSSTLPHSFGESRRIIEKDLGAPLETFFEWFEEKALASGAIAQVHRARLSPEAARRVGWKPNKGNDREVVIKVMHPLAGDILERDLGIIEFFSRGVQWLIPSLRWMSLHESMIEFQELMLSQLNLVQEGLNLERFRRDFAGRKDVVFPVPCLKLSSSRVLVESFEQGTLLSELLHGEPPKGGGEELIPESVRKSPIWRKQVARVGMSVFLEMLLENNFTHADLHPGNVMVRLGPRGKPQLVVLDVGLVTVLRPRDRENWFKVFFALLDGDGKRVAFLMWAESTATACADPREFEQEMGQLVASLINGKLQDVDLGSALTKVFQLVRQHRVRLESNFTSVVSSLLVMEGVGRGLDPGLKIFRVAREMVLRSPQLIGLLMKTRRDYLGQREGVLRQESGEL